MSESFDLLVCRDDPHRIDLRPAGPPEPLQEGQVRLAVDKFALTANNITYAMLGDSAGFWQFFPAAPPWGRIPVWGFADVIASRHEQVAIGERVFGFLPMSNEVVVAPERIRADAFGDAMPHRSALFPTYNQYARWLPGTAPEPHREDLHAIVRPLFFTSFVLDDFIAERDLFGARTVLLSSASSKTALGAGFLLRRRGAARVCGLTAARHREFVASSGCFDAAYAYDDIAILQLEAPVAYVDFSGDAALRRSVHQRFGAQLVHSLRIGATHWSALGEAAPPPGVASEAFFGPAQIRKRRADWGAAGLQARFDAAAEAFTGAASWLAVERRVGWPQAIEAYHAVLQGRADPARAFVVQLEREA